MEANEHGARGIEDMRSLMPAGDALLKKIAETCHGEADAIRGVFSILCLNGQEGDRQVAAWEMLSLRTHLQRVEIDLGIARAEDGERERTVRLARTADVLREVIALIGRQKVV